MIYHPPSTMQNNTDNQFIDQFMEWLSENLVTLSNVVMMGYFSIHINCKEVDNSAHIFTDTLKVLGLQICNDSPTHRLGNTLDLLITEINSQIQITNTGLVPLYWTTVVLWHLSASQEVT